MKRVVNGNNSNSNNSNNNPISFLNLHNNLLHFTLLLGRKETTVTFFSHVFLITVLFSFCKQSNQKSTTVERRRYKWEETPCLFSILLLLFLFPLSHNSCHWIKSPFPWTQYMVSQHATPGYYTVPINDFGDNALLHTQVSFLLFVFQLFHPTRGYGYTYQRTMMVIVFTQKRKFPLR